MGDLAREDGKLRKLSRLEEDLLNGDDATYVQNLREVQHELKSALKRIKVDHLARAKAMVDLIREEEALAKKEMQEEARARAKMARRRHK